VILKGNNHAHIQVIKLEQCYNFSVSPSQLAKISLYCINFITDSSSTICSITVNLTPTLKGNSTLAYLLKSYQKVFNELKRLSASKHHDHDIPLKEETQLVNLRPYRYFGLQKYVVEKMVNEMMELRVIQPSNNLFAYPIVLVKKRDKF
jgi:hypothetical protein